LYVQNDTLKAVPVRAETNAGLVLGTPVPLFQSVYLAADSSDDRQYDVSPDGRSVILAERSAPVASQSILILQNWARALLDIR
jgi:hypothetical protein